MRWTIPLLAPAPCVTRLRSIGVTLSDCRASVGAATNGAAALLRWVGDPQMYSLDLDIHLGAKNTEIEPLQ